MDGCAGDHFGGAALFIDVGLVFGVEEAQRTDDRVRRALAQATQRGGADILSQLFQALDIARLAFPCADAGEDFEHAAGTNAAGVAFPAALIRRELEHVLERGYILSEDRAEITAAEIRFGSGR